MFRMFGAKMWPTSAADWARYDRDRYQAVKDIMDARRRRGFGLFNLEDYLARAKGSRQSPVEQLIREDVVLGNNMQNKKLDPGVRAIGDLALCPNPGALISLKTEILEAMLIFSTEPLRFDDTFTRALEEIEEGTNGPKIKFAILTGVQGPLHSVQASSER